MYCALGVSERVTGRLANPSGVCTRLWLYTHGRAAIYADWTAFVLTSEARRSKSAYQGVCREAERLDTVVFGASR